MKKLITLSFLLHFSLADAQIKSSQSGIFRPERQLTKDFVYFKPFEKNLFAGDPMPFFKDGIFHVYYLIDINHSANPFGGHVWGHMSTKDLINWAHHPIAVELDSSVEKSICTGSVIFAENKFYAFYAERNDLNKDGKKEEYIKYATSANPDMFQKNSTNSIPLPPQFSQEHARDPHVFYDLKSKKYFMLVTTVRKSADVKNNYGILIYYTSPDLKQWKYEGEFYTPGDPVGFSIPECSEVFEWNGWYYLLYKVNGGTYYRKSKNITGPWEASLDDNIGSDYAMVFKTAPFTNGRRLAVGFVPSREGNKDNGGWQYAGNLVMREIIQSANGDLVATLIPELKNVYSKETVNIDNLKISSPNGFKYSDLAQAPADARITCKVIPKEIKTEFGFFLRKSTNQPNKDFVETDDDHYRLTFYPKSNKICLGNNCIDGVTGLDQPFSLEIVMEGDIIEVCVNNRRCHINRCPEKKGTGLSAYVVNGEIEIQKLQVFSK